LTEELRVRMDEERELIRRFVVPTKRRRMLEFLANPRKRPRITASLAHFRDLDPRWVVPVPPTQHFPAHLERLLRRLGAGDSCYVISENRELDARRLPLSEALECVVGRGMGTLISCVPGQLAFFEGEGPSDRCILARATI
jgi:hypothetical protein